VNLRESLAGLEGIGPRGEGPGPPGVSGQADLVFPSKVLGKFLASLTSRESPVVVDLGPVIPSNVNFFCDQLGCKLFVEDVCADLERHVSQDRQDALPEFLKTRFSRPAESVDGILCWNVLDYLDKRAAQALADQLMRVLKPEGVLLGFFGNLADRETHYTKYIVADEGNLKHQLYAGACRRQASWPNRDIIRLFAGLVVSDSFLLKNNQREILFRKPA
jgi:hypothetical protein